MRRLNNTLDLRVAAAGQESGERYGQKLVMGEVSEATVESAGSRVSDKDQRKLKWLAVRYVHGSNCARRGGNVCIALKAVTHRRYYRSAERESMVNNAVHLATASVYKEQSVHFSVIGFHVSMNLPANRETCAAIIEPSKQPTNERPWKEGKGFRPG